MSQTVSVPNQGLIQVTRLLLQQGPLRARRSTPRSSPGYAVCWDMANAAPGETANRGRVVNKPESGNLHLFAGIVTKVDQASDHPGGVVNGDAGWIEIAVAGHNVSAFTAANQTRNTTALVVTAGQWSSASTGTAPHNRRALRPVGISLETVDTSSTNANARICLKGMGLSPV
jgi:hypothetical protein